jgi:hypothetical protein
MSAARLSIARRPPLDLPLAAKGGAAPPSAPAPRGASDEPGRDAEPEFELDAAFDVPAFLRRQEG